MMTRTTVLALVVLVAALAGAAHAGFANCANSLNPSFKLYEPIYIANEVFKVCC